MKKLTALTIILLLVPFTFTMLVIDHKQAEGDSCLVTNGNLIYTHYNTTTGEVTQEITNIPIWENICKEENKK